MRTFHLILGPLFLVLLGHAIGCSSSASGGGGTGGTGSTSSTGSTGSTSATECLAMGASCQPGGTPCCGGVGCNYGTCTSCLEPSFYTQCMCGDVPVGPRYGCNQGESCGLDGGTPDDAGACQCVQVTVNNPCP